MDMYHYLHHVLSISTGEMDKRYGDAGASSRNQRHLKFDIEKILLITVIYWSRDNGS